MRAGLWARLADGDVPDIPGSEEWLITAMTPSDIPGSPLASLHTSIVNAIQNNDGLSSELDFNWRKETAGITTGEITLAALAERLL